MWKILIFIVFFVLLFIQLVQQVMLLIASRFRFKQNKYGPKDGVSAHKIDKPEETRTRQGSLQQWNPGDFTLTTRSGKEHKLPRKMVEDLFTLTPTADGNFSATPKPVQAQRKTYPELDFYDVLAPSGNRYNVPRALFEDIYDPADASPAMRWILKRTAGK